MIPRTIRPLRPDEQSAALDLVQAVFTDHADAEEGRLVRRLVEEIRAGRFHLPELELGAFDPLGELIGYVMFSRMHLEGNFADRLLMLTPAAVKTSCQRQHICRDILEYGFEASLRLGFDAVIVEGNPANYRARGFVTAAHHGILPGKTVHLPHIDCLMVKELRPGALEDIKGQLEYTDYTCLL